MIPELMTSAVSIPPMYAMATPMPLGHDGAAGIVGDLAVSAPRIQRRSRKNHRHRQKDQNHHRHQIHRPESSRSWSLRPLREHRA